MEIWRRRIVFCTLYLMDDCNEFLLWLLPEVLSNPSSTTMHVKWGRHICCLLSEGLVLFIYLFIYRSQLIKIILFLSFLFIFLVVDFIFYLFNHLAF